MIRCLNLQRLRKRGLFCSLTSLIQYHSGNGIGLDCHRDKKEYDLEIASIDQLEKAVLDLYCAQLTSANLLCLLRACVKWKALPEAKKLYRHITDHQIPLNEFLHDYMVMTLAKCGAIDEAANAFRMMPCRSVFSWSAMISSYVEYGNPQDALEAYCSMQKDGIEPDSYTFVGLLKACGSIRDLEFGKQVHVHACKKGFMCILHVGNALVNMYGNCRAILEAENVFSGLYQRNIVSWTTMLSVYIEQGEAQKVLKLYRQMKDEGLGPDEYAFVFALQACGILAKQKQNLGTAEAQLYFASLEIVKALHADAHKEGYANDLFVGTALVSVYGKCGTIADTENLFCRLSQGNLVTWNAMLSAYVEHGLVKKALLLYSQMQGERVKPGKLTYGIVFQACGILAEDENEGKLTKEKCLHILRAMFNDSHVKECSTSIHVATTLINTYAKCGSMSEAESVFNAIIVRDLVSWNAMLTAYVEKGEGAKALDLYKQMQDENVIQDDVTLICILLSCGETENCEMCKQLHFGIVHVKCDSIPAVVSSLIYAYGNCARMIDAHICFHYFPEPDTASWNACIVGYSGEANYTGALSMFENSKLEGIIPDEITFTSVLSACTHTGHVIEGILYFESMSRDNGIDPDMQHNSILVDLFARAGDFHRIEYMLARRMPNNLNVWLFLLGACRAHGNFELAKQAFDHAIALQPTEATVYILMSNIYADAEVI